MQGWESAARARARPCALQIGTSCSCFRCEGAMDGRSGGSKMRLWWCGDEWVQDVPESERERVLFR